MPAESVAAIKEYLVAEAQTMLKEDETTNRRMAQAGQVLIHNGHRVLTHCNTGALATGAYGTALGVLRAAWEAGKRFSVWVDETRPLLQGARLTTWELGKLGIPYTLIPDGAAATLMHQGKVDLVILGADRIAANGDTANKIGTYSVAVLAHHHDIPFYVAAPLSTFDFSIPDGAHIPVEERAAEEVTHLWGQAVAPAGAPALNLAFDVTPHDLIAGIVTEKGIMGPPFSSSLKPYRPIPGVRRCAPLSDSCWCWLLVALAQPAMAAGPYNIRLPASSEGVDPQALTLVGAIQHYRIKKGDDLLELARHYGLGYSELGVLYRHWDPFLPPRAPR